MGYNIDNNKDDILEKLKAAKRDNVSKIMKEINENIIHNYVNKVGKKFFCY